VKAKKKFAGKSKMILVLRLYVAGQTPKSLAAISNLKKICSEHFEAKCKIEVIDLLKKPAMARDHQIIAIPTLFPAHTNLQNYRGFVGHRARLSWFGLAQVESQVEELNLSVTGQSIKFSCRGIKFIYTRISRCFFFSFRLTMTRKI